MTQVAVPPAGSLRVAPQALDEAVPPRADVVIIGGGIVGVSAAYFLSARGVSVTLCEKGYIGAEQSSRALGWVRVTARDSRDVPLNLQSRQLWKQLNAMVGAETGYRQTGLLYLCENEGELATYEHWLERVRHFDIGSKIVNRDEAARLLPHTPRHFVGGLHTPHDGCAEPTLAAPAIAHGARRNGATIAIQCAARGIETTAGRVSAVITEKGRIQCQAALLAGGAWTGLFCGNCGIDLPQLPVGSFLMRTSPIAGPDISARNGPLGIRRNLDGGYSVGAPRSLAQITPESLRRALQFLPALRRQWPTLTLRLSRQFIRDWQMPRRWALDAPSPFEQQRVLDPGPAPWATEVWQMAREVYPLFRNASVVEQWGGIVDVTPDILPIISEVDKLPGLVVACGFSGGGFGAGPAAGQLAADLVTGARPDVDPKPYRYARFFDGSALRVAS